MASGTDGTDRTNGTDKAGERRRARSEAMRRAARREDRRRRAVRVGGGVAVVAALTAGLTVAVASADSGKSSSAAPGTVSIPADPLRTASGRITLPPWDTPSDPSARVAAAGLPMLSTEGTVEHIHVKLDVLVNGTPVTVPAEIGIDEANGQVSPLHTHDDSGIIHVESPVQASFTLGQFMTEWNVTLSDHQLGGLTANDADTVRWYVNGVEQSGDPAAYTLQAHDVITVAYGPADATVNAPATYDWPAGL